MYASMTFQVTTGPEHVGTARLVFRRLVAVPDLLAETGAMSLQDVRRFLQDWDQSGAARDGHCCDHWVLAIRDGVDSDGDAQRSVHPVPARAPERLALPAGTAGAELANALQDFDRRAGYPLAWYFHMVAFAGVPDAVGRQVADDHEQGFSYLPARDLALLRSWAALPYRA